MLTIATLNHQTGPVMTRQDMDWQGLACMVTSHTVSASKDGAGWMPAAIDPGPRTADRVAYWSVLVMDVEAHTEKLPDGTKRVIGPMPPPLEELATELELRGWDAALATSHSHEGPAETGTQGPRYRVALRPSRPIKPDEIRPLALHVAALLGLSECVDTSCMEPARLFYLPKVPAERLNLAQSAVIEGEALNVDALLTEARAMDAPVRRQSGGETGRVIQAFNEQADWGAILEPHGYEPKGRNRWVWPGSTTGLPGVVVLAKTDRLYSHHPHDPLYCQKHTHDQFSAWCALEHGGNVIKAVKTAAKLLGMERKPPSMDEVLDGKADIAATDPAPAEKPGFVFVSAGELLTNPKPTDFLVDELVEAQSLALLFAPPSAGKSFLALSWAACIATGTPWCGREVQQGAVFYLAGEGHAGITRRLKAWELHHGISLTDAPLFVSKVPAALMDVASAASVVKAIADLEWLYGKPALIVVDTFARNMGTGDENSNADIGTFVNHLDRMKSKLGCSVLLVHHSGHMEKDRARGGSALNAAMDASFQLEKKAGETIELTQRKAKESELGKPMLFGLTQVALPGWLDSKGREMHSAVLVEKVGTANEFRVKPLTPTQQQGMEAFYRAAAEHGTPEDMGLLVAVQLEHWRTEFYKTATGDTPAAKRQAFHRVRNDLVNTGRVTVLDDVYRVDATDIGLQCARLVDSAMQAGGEKHPSVTA